MTLGQRDRRGMRGNRRKDYLQRATERTASHNFTKVVSVCIIKEEDGVRERNKRGINERKERIENEWREANSKLSNLL